MMEENIFDTVKSRVRKILEDNESARSSDDLLFAIYTHLYAKQMVYLPSLGVNCSVFKSVERARRWCQNHCSGLAGKPHIQEQRQEVEVGYKKNYGGVNFGSNNNELF